mgnify:CR=1 FL=1
MYKDQRAEIEVEGNEVRWPLQALRRSTDHIGNDEDKYTVRMMGERNVEGKIGRVQKR